MFSMLYFNPGDCNTAILYISYSYSDCLIEASRTAAAGV